MNLLSALKEFIFKHRHKWKEYKRLNQERHMYFYCRECECGANEIQNVGPMGDDQWHDISIPFKNEWEQEWLDNSARVEGE